MLAIVIPYFKITFFEATLQSLVIQTDKRFKVYVGNDASPDDPEILIKQYFVKLNLVYKQFNNNLGGKSLVKHWDRCITLVGEEEWITILGDDDVYEPNVVEEFYNNIQEINKNEINVIRFSTLKINENATPISNIYQHPKIESSVDFFFRNSRSSLSEYVFNKNQLIKTGFKDFNLGWFSDVLAVMEVSEFKYVFTINNAVVYIRVSDLSISGNKFLFKQKLNASFKYYYLMLRNYEDNFNDHQIELLNTQLNKSYINNKKRLDWYLKIVVLNLSRLKFLKFLKFHKQILNFYLK